MAPAVVIVPASPVLSPAAYEVWLEYDNTSPVSGGVVTIASPVVIDCVND